MYLLVKKNLILSSFSLIFCSDERFVNTTLEFLQKEVKIKTAVIINTRIQAFLMKN
ncbi:MAG: hypothetical protein NZ872_00295 [Archaeoglobaceae archaeon]|nr:hypothetical protein [Archaeoglobaceae archaeon]MDW8127640.1 hypothetical protein [Archaeoglobaceae archaeon]